MAASPIKISPGAASPMLHRLTQRLGEMAQAYALPKVMAASSQLGRALSLVRESNAVIKLFIPHYWAIYVHDGRGSYGPGSPATRGKPARFLVWFRNPNNDPRLRAGLQAIRRNQVRRLTKEQFKFWLDQNKLARRLGLPAPMVVYGWPNQPGKKAPPDPGRFYFGNAPGQGMHGFLDHARPEAKAIVQKEMRKLLGEEFFKKKKDIIRVRI